MKKPEPEEISTGFARTTVVLREDQLEKLKILSWWENTTLKDLFCEMIEQYLSSKTHLDKLLKERNKSLQKKFSSTDQPK